MSVFLGMDGKPLLGNGSAFARASTKKAKPVLGEAFGSWAGRDLNYRTLPGGGAVQFDVSRLVTEDYRAMRSHYQVNSSLSVLSFMIHQLEWKIECDNKRIAAHVEENMQLVWTRLVRAMSQALWAGHSGSILQWENDTSGRRIMLSKIKDIEPEASSINWKYVEGAMPHNSPEGSIPPKIKVFDGIKVSGMPGAIPQENSFWYPLLMENGDYTGRKLLQAAFQPWYFSMLLHLFSNRYFERYGEPLPIGRAPQGGRVNVGGSTMEANEYMLAMMGNLRSRGSVMLPSDKIEDADGKPSNDYEYDIQYLESQMRGADFERYLTRLDEEISLALFTPLLLLRSGGGSGSYNLGTSHMQMFLWQLNALADDWGEYINRYIVEPMVDYNFGTTAKRARLKFHKTGRVTGETARAIIAQVLASGRIGVDLEELGQSIGLTLTQVDALSGEVIDGVASTGGDTGSIDKRAGRVREQSGGGGGDTSLRISKRVEAQAAARFAKYGHLPPGWRPDFGYDSHMTGAQKEALEHWHDDLVGLDGLGLEDYSKYLRAGIGGILRE